MCIFIMHCGRGPQNTRDLPVASISRLSDQPRKFRRFAERPIFGKATKLIGTVWITFVKFWENTQSINCQSLGFSVIFQMYLKTSEICVMSNCYETINLGLFSKLLVLYKVDRGGEREFEQKSGILFFLPYPLYTPATQASLYLINFSLRFKRQWEVATRICVEDYARLMVFVWLSLVLVILQ